MYEVRIPYEVLKKMNGKELGVYVALKKYMDWNKYTCYPSVATLADDLDCSENTVRKHLRQLEKKGLINIEYRVKKNKKGKRWNDTNLYTFILEKIFSKGVLQNKKGDTSEVKDERELINNFDMNDTNTIKFELEEEFGQAIVDKALQQLSIVTKKGTVVNHLKNYLKAICSKLQAQQKISQVSNNKPFKQKKNSPASTWGSSSNSRSSNYSADELEHLILKKRKLKHGF